MKKKVLSLVLAIATCLGLTIPVSAITNGHTREEAVSKAISLYTDNASKGYQCVALIQQYYKYLANTTVPGNACDYRSNKLPDGWKRYKVGETVPQPGDIVVWGPGVDGANSKYGHVGIVVDVDSTSLYYVDYNGGRPKDSRGYRTRGVNKFSCVIRPDWSYSASIANGTYTLAPMCAPNARLDVNGGSQDNFANVQIYGDNGTTAQQWDITALGNGYYSLTSKISGKVLDAYLQNAVSGQNVIQYAWYGGSEQQWKFKDAGDGYYYIIPRCNESLCLDVFEARSDNGTNVKVYTANQSSAQKWKLINQADGWGPWSDWTTTPVYESATRQVEVKTEPTQVKVVEGHTEYRYVGYATTDGRHECWCETYLRNKFGSAVMRYSDWSTTRYSANGTSWSCGNCRGNHIGVGSYGSDRRAWWPEYTLPNGKNYYWEESRTVGEKYETRTVTQYRYRDKISG